jgi:hypothetical protein
MDEQHKTNINKTIRDVRYGSDTYQRLSNSSTLNLHRESILRSSAANVNDETFPETPKRQKLDNSDDEKLNTSVESIPGSPWEWRRMKGEVSII